MWCCAGVFFAAILAELSPSGSAQPTARLVVSSLAGSRLSPGANEVQWRHSRDGQSNLTGVAVDPNITYQKIDGFGASLLQSGAIALSALPDRQQDEVMRALFHPKDGAGFSLAKVAIAGCDANEFPYSSYDDIAGDDAMAHFSIAQDLRNNGTVALVKRAQKFGSFQIESPMDFPPDWMLERLSPEQCSRRGQGGSLSCATLPPERFDALARYYLAFIRAYESHGITIDYLSMFNEPGLDCCYTNISGQSISRLLVEHVGPLFRQGGMKTRLAFGEPSSRGAGHDTALAVMANKDAAQYVDILFYHGYDAGYTGDPGDPSKLNSSVSKIADLHRRFPTLRLWMTEVCWAVIAGYPLTAPSLPRLDFADGLWWGQMILKDLSSGASGWIYWNAILDHNGGPYSVSPSHNNPPGNIQQPVVVVNASDHTVHYTGLYYFLAHFSKFVRPGSVRVDAISHEDGVETVAFKDGAQLIVQLVNSRTKNFDIELYWGEWVLPVSLPAVSITTCVWNATTLR